MPATRSSPESSQGSPQSATKKSGIKRSADTSSSPAAKRGKTSSDNSGKEQKTLEETMSGIENDNDIADQINENDERAEPDVQKPTKINGHSFKESNREEELTAREEAVQKREEAAEKKEQQEDDKNAFDEIKGDAPKTKNETATDEPAEPTSNNTNGSAIVEDEERASEVPRSILEKGLIYFFFRGRVNIDSPQSVDEVARTHLVLRPLPKAAKLVQGPIEDEGNARLLALPKKVLPMSKRDKFLMFVEKAGVNMGEIKDGFKSDEYATRTVGTSHVPSVTPFAEGVYAITSTGKDSHLAYHITVPSTIGKLQENLGLHEKGSYVLSVKNPEAGGPANATIDNPAKYPSELQSKFRNLRWTNLEPSFLDYTGTQVLVIGEGMGEFSGAVQETDEDARDDKKETAEEELEKLEEEDQDRVEHLKTDDPIFADLGLSSKEFGKLKTTW